MVSMTELGLDIHEEILVRLRVSDLMRCKSVCKSWNSLISSCCFSKSHLNYIHNKRRTNEIGDTRIIVSNGASSMCVNECFYWRKGECQLVGSSNGLVCISRYDTDFLVVNPSTREVKQLRNFSQEDVYGEYDPYNLCVSGFGYDSSIDDFKVVIGCKFLPNEYLMFKVLELKTNIWRSVRTRKGYDILYGDGILCNGAIHWLDRDNKPSRIVSFDLSKEVFINIRLPKLDDQYDSWTLGTMKDRLCIFPGPHVKNLSKNKEMEIWVRKNYNANASWERKLPPPGYDVNKIIMDYIPHRIFLSGNVHIWLLEESSGAPVLVRSIDHPHNSEDFRPHEHIRLSTYSECNYNYDEHVFVKSLVSPHGMGEGDGNGDGDGDGDDYGDDYSDDYSDDDGDGDGDDDGDGDGDNDGGDGNINDAISLSTLFL